MFPEGERQGLYHTADATLWFFHALRPLRQPHGRPRRRLRRCCRRSSRSFSVICAGTRFGIRVDPGRRAARRRAPQGYQLTWMDAKVGDWVVTPRRGKAVEINALWYNALSARSRPGSTRSAAPTAAACRAAAADARATRSTGDSGTRRQAISTTSSTASSGDDPACRPNQIFAISLRHPVLDPARWRAVLDVVDATSAHAGRACARSRPAIPTTSRSTTATCARATPPITGHGLGLAHRAVHRRLAEGASRRPSRGAHDSSRASRLTSTRRASGRSARSSTPSRRSRRAAASRRRGAWRKCCACGKRQMRKQAAEARSATWKAPWSRRKRRTALRQELRNATIGSTREAFRAGRYPEMSATARKTAAIAT